MNSLIYEDKPPFGPWLLFFLVPFLILLLAFVYYLHLSREESVLAVVAIAVSSAFFWAIQPRRYQILDDRVKIIRGLAVSIDIPFNKINNIKEASWADANFAIILWLSYITSYKNVVEIAVTSKLAPKVYISPNNRTLFLENLNKAVYDWKRGATKVGS